ncbi:MAG: hypothetical protein PHI12_08895 [Dehalococcoidales bacterium]|nr:hypothetical protein [Dehalococcoidales bacterium]
MRPSNGEVGVLLQDGRQIGGFMGWSIILLLNSKEKQDGREYKKSSVRAKAQKFWLFEKPTGEITAKYYGLVEDTLAIISQSKIEADFGEYELNKMIPRMLEMIWI